MSTIYFNPYRFAGAGIQFINRKSLVLDGVDQYMDVGDISVTGDWTIAMFWNNTDTDTAVHYPYGVSSGKGLFVERSSAWDEWGFQATGTLGTWNNLDENRWYHLAVTKSWTTYTLYQDGIEVFSGTSWDTDLDDIQIGTRPWTGFYAWGNADQVIAVDKAFSQLEIQELITLRDVSEHSAYANVVSWWDFEDDDISGTTVTDKKWINDGTLQNGATNAVCIPYPYAYQLIWENSDTLPFEQWGGFSFDFDGINDVITVPDSSDFTFGNGTTDQPFSISYWAKMDDATRFRAGGKIDASNEEYITGTNPTDNFQLVLYDDSSGGFAGLRTTSAVTDFEGEWAFFTATYNGGGDPTTDTKLYINGSEITSTTSVVSGSYTAMENTGTTFRFGETNNNFANGKITDMIVWNKELSAAEITSIYNNHQPRQEENESLSANIVAGWRGYGSLTGTGNVPDFSGNGHDGTTSGMTDTNFVYSFPRAILADYGSVDFNGTDEYITVPDANDLSFGNASNDSPFSLYARFKTDNTGANQSLFFKGDTSGSDFEYGAVYSASGFVYLVLYDTDGTNRIRMQTDSFSFVTNTWYNVVFTYDGSSSSSGINIYVNGVLQSVTSNDAGSYVAMHNLGDPLYIGAIENGAGTTNEFDGHLSHMGIVGKELSSCEVIELHNDGSPVDITQVTFVNDVVSHWNLDANDTLTTTGGVTDQVGTNDGTAQNMTAGNFSDAPWDYPTN